MRKINLFLIVIGAFLLVQCYKIAGTQNKNKPNKETTTKNKIVVYQIFTRLFGNKNTNNIPWGTKEQNGVGKLNDITDTALQEIKKLGVTHVWYTGVPHHALVGDYKHIGISDDDPEVVKGRAGSPYAVKDYYNINPDLAVNPIHRLAEYEQLIQRTHQNGLQVIMDIVPNHIARKYESISAPKGVIGFGQEDNTSVEFDVDNNFYYVPNQSFVLPTYENGYQPLGGDTHSLIDGMFNENPAKWTGNGARSPQPKFDDWYETVKLNFGVSPDGKKEFPSLPKELEKASFEAHYQFWKDKKVPNTWLKFKEIALYWLDKGVDGFRYDMAEMVSVEFWSYLNSAIKMKNPKAFLLAEIYNPKAYRDYIYQGKMDYLYDKVQLYDTLRNIVQHHHSTDGIVPVQEDLQDISSHMLHFLENHDEQRIASPEFAGIPENALPAMVVSHTISDAPTMIYFGQEVGEKGAEKGGFGSPSRTSIFDYVGVPAHQQWMNNGKFDGGQLSHSQKELRRYYQKLLNIDVQGTYKDIHLYNRKSTSGYTDKIYSFVRGEKEGNKYVIVSNFSPSESFTFSLQIPESVVKDWQLSEGNYTLTDKLFGSSSSLLIKDKKGTIKMKLNPLESFIYEIQ
ncbi:MAG: alpha-amylase family protein [Capnocytophaga sp.]|nr:alpha-amylase family protein [Capnocytophaga sp.]